MPLTGAEFDRICKAIQSAFTRDELRQVLYIGIGEDFDALVAEKPYKHQIFDLVRWADRQNRFGELLACLIAERPRNADLAALGTAGQAMPQPRLSQQIPTSALDSAKTSAVQGMPSIAEHLGIEWITIPAGKFLMGSDKQMDPSAQDYELPQHEVDLPEFRLSKYPITNEQYAQYVVATGATVPEGWDNGKPPVGNECHPVVNVSWHDAVIFCQWAGVRLPTEAEWEKAARGIDGRIWPWGNQPPDRSRCNFDDIEGETTLVSKYPQGASPFGVMDMAGNVMEWTSSRLKGYPYDAADGRERQGGRDSRVLRGASFRVRAEYTRCAYRDRLAPFIRDDYVGFRVVALIES